jgi:CheY-like chemotaxis protein
MSLRILVVDDEAAVCKVLKAMLESLGMETVAHTDSQEAARSTEAERFDCVILDARMPNLDGFELSQLIRKTQLNKDVPIVMITGIGDVEAMRRGFKAGVTFFLNKPTTREKLHALFRATKGAIMQERRRHLRVPYSTTVTCRLENKRFLATSLNIGERGMQLEASGGVPVGGILELQFTLPGVPRPLKVHARVVRKEPPDRTTLEFLELSASEQGAIQAYVYEGVGE